MIPRYVGYIGVEAYGLVGTYVTIQALAQLFDFGMSASVNRQLSRYAVLPGHATKMRDFVRTSEVIYLAIGGALGGLLFIFAPAIADHWLREQQLSRDTIVDALRAIAVLTAVQWPLTFYQGAILGLNRPGALNIVRVTATAVNAAGALLVLAWLAPTAGALFRWQILVSLVQVTLMAILVWRTLPPPEGRPHLRFDAVRSAVPFAAGMTAVTLTATFNMQIDKLALSRLVPLDAFGYYTLAGVLGNGMLTIAAAFFATMFPMFSRLAALGDTAALMRQYRRMWGVMAAFAIPFAACVAAFSFEALLLWTGSATTARSAAPITRLLVIGSALNALMQVPYAVQLASGNTRLPLQLNLLLTAMAIPALLLVVPRYGSIGAAGVWIGLNLAYLLVGVPATAWAIPAAALSSWLLSAVIVPATAASLTVALLRGLLPAPVHPVSSLATLAAAWLAALAVVVLTNSDLRHEALAVAGAGRRRVLSSE